MNERGPVAEALQVLDAASHGGPVLALDQVGQSLAVVGRGAVEGAVEGVAAQQQVEVMVEGDPDPPVDLHAVLQELGAVVADERLGRAQQLLGVGEPRPPPPWRRR